MPNSGIIYSSLLSIICDDLTSLLLLLLFSIVFTFSYSITSIFYSFYNKDLRFYSQFYYSIK